MKEGWDVLTESRQACDNLAGDTHPWDLVGPMAEGQSQTCGTGLSPQALLLLGGPGALQRVPLWEGQGQPSGPGQWGDLWLGEPMGHGTCGYCPAPRVMSCASAPFEARDVPLSPSQGVHIWALGQPTCTLLWDHSSLGLRGGCGDSPTVGTTHEGLYPMLYPIAYCQGGVSLSTTWIRVTLYYGQPALWRDLGFAEFYPFCCFCPFCWV